MLTVVTAGLPLSAKSLLTEAMNLSFGEGVIEIIELTKTNLRQRVRLSQKNVSDVLVILDGVSTDACRDIENGLYNSDKFHTYVNESEFVSYLNNKFGLSLSVSVSEEELSAGTSDSSKEEISSSVIEKYESQLLGKDLVIKNLKERIVELNQEIESFCTPKEDSVSTEELEAVRQDNISLKNKVLDAENNASLYRDRISELEKERDSLQKSVEDLENKRNSIFSDYESAVKELTDLKVVYSAQSGVVRTKTEKVEELERKLDDANSKLESFKDFEVTQANLENEISKLSLESSRLNIDLDSKTTEIGRLKSELESLRSKEDYSQVAEELKVEVGRLTTERDDARKKSDSLLQELRDLQSRSEQNRYDRTVFEDEISRLKERISSDDASLEQLNKEKLELQGKLSILEKSTNRDSDMERLITELTDLRSSYDSLSNGVFGRIAAQAMPNSSSPIFLTKKGVTLSNVFFTFAGSTESRKGAYKCIMDDCIRSKSSQRYLLVDLVTETSVDYVFEIKRVVSGIEWFRKGGSVQPYLSKTKLKNVNVLSPGIGYINDSYFLSIDWERRLTELENSGYCVVVFCGDISNIVGRILHETFADLGKSVIYVHGNAVGSRTIVTNIRGLTNSKSSVVVYFDFNPKLKKFYDLVNKTNRCEILNVAR